MKAPTARELLLRWKESSIMERRAIESELRQRSMPIRLPTEEAIVYALIDWLEDVEKRLAKRPKPRKKAKAKQRPLRTSAPGGVVSHDQPGDLPATAEEAMFGTVGTNGEAA